MGNQPGRLVATNKIYGPNQNLLTMKKIGIFCLLCMIALSACRNNIDDVDKTEDPYVPPIINWTPQSLPVDGSVTGFVSDTAQEPIAGATVKMGNLTTTTDDYGHFFFNDVTLNAAGTLVTVEKQDYFNGSRRFSAMENKMNRVKIEMLTKSFNHNFNAAAGGTVQTTDGASIMFPPNSIKKADGTIYTGDVKVAAKWLDPSDVRTFDQMPGNLQGVDREIEEVALGTYGMMAVELESDAGESLNISEGNTATLSMPVPTSLQGNAPSEIPLWSYNEEHGVWVEEEYKATLTNGVYVGEVSHFSFWNCDYPYPLIELSGVLQDDNGNPLSNYQIGVTLNLSGTGYGFTAADGSFSGKVPANEDLVLEVYGRCYQVIYSQNIGPYPDNEDLGTITVSSSGLSQTFVSGELLCNGAPISNGLVIFEFDGYKVYEYITGSTFDVSFNTCPSTTDVTFTGVDLDALEQSDPVIIAANQTHVLGDVNVCEAMVQNIITITVDDGNGPATEDYVPCSMYIDSTATGLGTYFIFEDLSIPADTIYMSFSMNGMVTGNYDNTNNVINAIIDDTNQWAFGDWFSAQETFSSFNVSSYGAVGEPIIGTFGGMLTNYGVQPPAVVSVAGSFSVIRQ